MNSVNSLGKSKLFSYWRIAIVGFFLFCSVLSVRAEASKSDPFEDLDLFGPFINRPNSKVGNAAPMRLANLLINKLPVLLPGMPQGKAVRSGGWTEYSDVKNRFTTDWGSHSIDYTVFAFSTPESAKQSIDAIFSDKFKMALKIDVNKINKKSTENIHVGTTGGALTAKEFRSLNLKPGSYENTHTEGNNIEINIGNDTACYMYYGYVVRHQRVITGDRDNGGAEHSTDSLTQDKWMQGEEKTAFLIRGKYVLAVTVSLSAVQKNHPHNPQTGQGPFVITERAAFPNDIWNKVLKIMGSSQQEEPASDISLHIVSGTIFDVTANKMLNPGELLPLDHVLMTGKENIIAISGPKMSFQISPMTKFSLISKTQKKNQNSIFLFFGRIWALFKGKPTSPFETYNSVAGCEGTSFDISYDSNNGETKVSVFEGVVNLTSKNGNTSQLKINAGMQATMDKNGKYKLVKLGVDNDTPAKAGWEVGTEENNIENNNAISTTPVSVNNTSPSLPFFENFNSGLGNWEIKDKNAALYNEKLYWTSQAAVLKQQIPMENVTIEFDGYCESNGINVYLQDSKNEGYIIIFGGWFNKQSASDVGKNNENRQLVSGKVWEPKQWQHYKIVLQGNILKAFCDNRKIIERTVPLKFSGTGTLKFDSWNSRIGIDNIKIVKSSSGNSSTIATSNIFEQAVALPCASNSAFIRSLYNCILHREPSNQELQAQVNRLNNGVSRKQMITYFLMSPGYKNLNKSNAQFITDACQAIYARQPTKAELSNWPRTTHNIIIAEMFKNQSHLKATQRCTALWSNSPVISTNTVKLPFFENFNSGIGNWEIQDKKAVLSGGKLYWDAGSYQSAALKKQIPMEDVTIEFDGYCESNGINVYLRNQKDEGYIIIFGGWFNKQSASDVGKNSENRQMVAGKVWEPKRWQHYKIVLQGNILKAFCDNRKIIERTVPLKFSGTGILKFDSWNTRIGIDNISIKKSLFGDGVSLPVSEDFDSKDGISNNSTYKTETTTTNQNTITPEPEKNSKSFDQTIIDKELIHDPTASNAYKEYMDAYNAMAKLMSAGKGDTPEGRQAYAYFIKAKNKYEASLARTERP